MLEILQVTPDNKDCLDIVDAEIFDDKIDPDRLASLLDDDDHILIVAIHDGAVIGQVLGMIHRHPVRPTGLYIDDLAVSDRMQRRGVATKMLRQIIELGKEKGCEEIRVSAGEGNEAAKDFYESLNLSTRIAMIFEGDLVSRR